MSDADALKKAIFRLSFNVYVTQSVTLKFQEKYRHCTRGDREGHARGPRPGAGSDPERFERHRARLHVLLAGQQRSCVLICLVALEAVASAVREPAVREAVWIAAA